MVARPSRHYSLADYLAVEEASSVRHELLDGQIFAMAGGTPEHAALAAAIQALLVTHLRGRPCRAYSSDLRIRVAASGLYTYPDAAVVCGEPRLDPASPTHVTNPTIVFEVLSESTEEYDREEKRLHYQQIETVREYVLVAQDRALVEVFAREPDGPWTQQTYGRGERAPLASIGLAMAVDDLYELAGLTQL